MFPGDRVVFLEPADESFAEACSRLTDVAENGRLEFVEQEIFGPSSDNLALLETPSSSASLRELLDLLMVAEIPNQPRPDPRRGQGGGGGGESQDVQEVT